MGDVAERGEKKEKKKTSREQLGGDEKGKEGVIMRAITHIFPHMAMSLGAGEDGGKKNDSES